MKYTKFISMCGLAAALALGGWGCGGASPAVAQNQGAQAAAPVDPATAGTLTVHLVPDGLPGTLSHLNLVLTALELRVGGSWRPVPLAAPGQPVDILSAAPALLASRAPWPAGGNDAMRFTLGAKNTVQFAADDPETTHPLAVPSSFVSTMGLPGSFSVAAGNDTDLWIAFDVENVVLRTSADPPGYVFSPGPVRGYDLGATGSISGLVTTQAAAPLPGAAVTAQLRLRDGEPGAAIAFRTVRTGADGRYSLDLLPIGPGYAWCVVSQPAAGEDTFYPQASRGFLLGPGLASRAAADLSLAPAAAPGSLAGTVAAAGASGEDLVDLVQEISVDGVPCAFVLGSAALEPKPDGSFSFSFPSVPPGIYSAVLNDYSLSQVLGRVDQTRTTAPFVVAAGARTVLTF